MKENEARAEEPEQSVDSEEDEFEKFALADDDNKPEGGADDVKDSADAGETPKGGDEGADEGDADNKGEASDASKVAEGADEGGAGDDGKVKSEDGKADEKGQEPTAEQRAAEYRRQKQQQSQKASRERFFAQVRQKHADVDDIRSSREFLEDWLPEQTSDIQYKATEGNVADAVEVLNKFKADMGRDSGSKATGARESDNEELRKGGLRSDRFKDLTLRIGDRNVTLGELRDGEDGYGTEIFEAMAAMAEAVNEDAIQKSAEKPVQSVTEAQRTINRLSQRLEALEGQVTANQEIARAHPDYVAVQSSEEFERWKSGLKDGALKDMAQYPQDGSETVLVLDAFKEHQAKAHKKEQNQAQKETKDMHDKVHKESLRSSGGVSHGENRDDDRPVEDEEAEFEKAMFSK